MMSKFLYQKKSPTSALNDKTCVQWEKIFIFSMVKVCPKTQNGAKMKEEVNVSSLNEFWHTQKCCINKSVYAL